MSISPALHTTQRPAKTTNLARQWWVYLPDVSPDAEDWYSAYDRFGLEISQQTTVVVRDLQRRKLERARLALENCHANLKVIQRVAPRPVVTVVEVAYLSTLAYYHYHAAEFNKARRTLERAVSLIEETLSLAPFLTPCAGQCYDYRLHLARIARAELQWEEMREQIQIGRKMVYGELPLCHSIQGPVYLEDVCAFYRSTAPMNEVEREALERLSDPRTIQREYDNLCVAATVVPYIVVDWLGR